MALSGDHYSVTIKPSHLDWGRFRFTDTREKIAGEGYVMIPRHFADLYGIHLGQTYTASFADGFPSFAVRAAGNSHAGDKLAKQFQGDGDLKAFGRWYENAGAEVGDTVNVTFTDPNTILFELVKP